MAKIFFYGPHIKIDAKQTNTNEINILGQAKSSRIDTVR